MKSKEQRQELKEYEFRLMVKAKMIFAPNYRLLGKSIQFWPLDGDSDHPTIDCRIKSDPLTTSTSSHSKVQIVASHSRALVHLSSKRHAHDNLTLNTTVACEGTRIIVNYLFWEL